MAPERDLLKMYFEHQFDRIRQLEQQRLTVTNLVLGLTIVSYSLAFEDLSKLNPINGLGLPLMVISINMVALLYNSRSLGFIKMHQARATKLLLVHAPELHAIDVAITKPFQSPDDPFRRARLHDYLHWILIGTATLPPFLYFFQ